MPWLLVLFRVGLFVGNILGGRAAGRNLGATLVTLFIGLVVILAVFSLTAENRIATIVALVLMCGFGIVTVPAMQMCIMHHSGDAQTLGSGANIAAFNVGNAFGAWIGGLTIASDLGYTFPLWAGALVTIGGLITLLIAGRARGGELRRSQTETSRDTDLQPTV